MHHFVRRPSRRSPLINRGATSRAGGTAHCACQPSPVLRLAVQPSHGPAVGAAGIADGKRLVTAADMPHTRSPLAPPRSQPYRVALNRSLWAQLRCRLLLAICRPAQPAPSVPSAGPAERQPRGQRPPAGGRPGRRRRRGIQARSARAAAGWCSQAGSRAWAAAGPSRGPQPPAASTHRGASAQEPAVGAAARSRGAAGGRRVAAAAPGAAARHACWAAAPGAGPGCRVRHRLLPAGGRGGAGRQVCGDRLLAGVWVRWVGWLVRTGWDGWAGIRWVGMYGRAGINGQACDG